MLNPTWSVFLEEGHKFLMTGKKRMGKKTSNYLISSDPKELERKSVNVVGKVRANWVSACVACVCCPLCLPLTASRCGQTGSGYHIYDHGMNPTKATTTASVRRDLGFVGFAYDSMGPGKMEVCAGVCLRLPAR